jgi:prefoldin beta subunit
MSASLSSTAAATSAAGSPAADASDNPGHLMASAVDGEVAKYRNLQSEIDKLGADLQVVRSQETETEMVEAEIRICLRNDEPVYKMVGPALIKQDVDEAVETVQKRLEFIRGERDRITGLIQAKQKAAEGIAHRVQEMQSQLQRTTAAAVQAVAQHHQQQQQG